MTEKNEFLLTPSLLNSYLYYKESEYEDSRESFLRAISRDSFEGNIYTAIGNKFENNVAGIDPPAQEDFTLHNPEEWYRAVEDFKKIVQGGANEVKGSKKIHYKDNTYVIYGREDWVKADTCIDIKTTQNYREFPKFSRNAGTFMYPFIFDTPKMVFLIMEYSLTVKNEVNVKSTIREDYVRDDDKMFEMVYDFVDYLEIDKEAERLFKKNW